jgi:hypothetical protein
MKRDEAQPIIPPMKLRTAIVGGSKVLVWVYYDQMRNQVGAVFSSWPTAVVGV